MTGQLLSLAGVALSAYVPDDDFVGDDSFEYTIADENGGEDTCTVDISVENTPPTCDDELHKQL